MQIPYKGAPFRKEQDEVHMKSRIEIGKFLINPGIPADKRHAYTSRNTLIHPRRPERGHGGRSGEARPR